MSIQTCLSDTFYYMDGAGVGIVHLVKEIVILYIVD